MYEKVPREGEFAKVELGTNGQVVIRAATDKNAVFGARHRRKFVMLKSGLTCAFLAVSDPLGKHPDELRYISRRPGGKKYIRKFKGGEEIEFK